MPPTDFNTLFGLQWGLAILGIVLKSVGGIRYAKLSVAVYLAMGWLVLIAAVPVMNHVPPWGLFWLVAGGIAYTVGGGFFALEPLPPLHFLLPVADGNVLTTMWD